jgi:hypothetical protein
MAELSPASSVFTFVWAYNSKSWRWGSWLLFISMNELTIG